MKIRVFGANHETASLELRECLSLTETKKIELLEALIELDIKEAVVLSTCGRFEVYVADRKDDVNVSSEALLTFIQKQFQVDVEAAHFYVKEDEAAIGHLFSVTAGLNSAVLGEDQILGQVKEAIQFAMTLGTSGKVLNRLFQEAVTTAKALKTELKMSEHPLSLSYIAIKRAKQFLGDLEGKTVLMMGLGKMGQLALKTLLDEGVKTLFCAVRNPSKLDTVLLKDPRVQLVSFDDRHAYVKDSDIIIGATSAPHTILHASQIEAMKPGSVLLDLALPRDFDAEIAKQFNVHLLDVDGLKDLSEENQKKREVLGEASRAIVEEAVGQFKSWMNMSQVDHVIRLWHEDIDHIHDETMTYFQSKLQSVSQRDLALIDKMLEAALKRFIRKPLTALKLMEDQEKRLMTVALLEELFANEEKE